MNRELLTRLLQQGNKLATEHLELRKENGREVGILVSEHGRLWQASCTACKLQIDNLVRQHLAHDSMKPIMILTRARLHELIIRRVGATLPPQDDDFNRGSLIVQVL
jgi:hypothetical protein